MKNSRIKKDKKDKQQQQQQQQQQLENNIIKDLKKYF